MRAPRRAVGDVEPTISQIMGWIRWVSGSGVPPSYLDHYYKVVLFEMLKAILKRSFPAQAVPHVVEVRAMWTRACLVRPRPA